ncbi:MAG: NRDE family protein, partial [Steroidobacteraceae bacterium]
VTNFRELAPPRPGAPSRGALIPRYLGEAAGAQEFFRRLETNADDYSGFNLLLADREALWYGCNRAQPFARALAPGVYGLCNEFLDTPWPKLQRVKLRFDSWLHEPGGTAAALFALLGERTPAAADSSLPRGGLPREWQRILSAPFVVNPTYGTRCSTVVMLEPDGGTYLAERRFDSAGEPHGETELRLNPGEWP